jgi:hypothetical protein
VKSKSVRFDQLSNGDMFTVFPNSKAVVWTKQPESPIKNNAVDEKGAEAEFKGNQYVYKKGT